jgi:hypothetical protein
VPVYVAKAERTHEPSGGLAAATATGKRVGAARELGRQHLLYDAAAAVLHGGMLQLKQLKVASVRHLWVASVQIALDMHMHCWCTAANTVAIVLCIHFNCRSFELCCTM